MSTYVPSAEIFSEIASVYEYSPLAVVVSDDDAVDVHVPAMSLRVNPDVTGAVEVEDELSEEVGCAHETINPAHTILIKNRYAIFFENITFLLCLSISR